MDSSTVKTEDDAITRPGPADDTPIVKNEQSTDHNHSVSKQEMESEEGDDDEDDEDDHFYKPSEPCYDKADSLKFRQLCIRFETLWKQKSKKKKPTKDEMLDYLLPQNLRKFITTDKELSKNNSTEEKSVRQQQSIFPVLRLMCPDKDTTRPRLWMKEAVIGKTWAEAIGLANKGSDYKKLTNYNDPTAAGITATGDISMCVYEVVKKRFPEFDKKSGGVTVGEMNELFNELAGIRKPGEEGGLTINPTGNSRGSQKRRDVWVKKLLAKKFSVSCMFPWWLHLSVTHNSLHNIICLLIRTCSLLSTNGLCA